MASPSTSGQEINPKYVLGMLSFLICVVKESTSIGHRESPSLANPYQKSGNGSSGEWSSSLKRCLKWSIMTVLKVKTVVSKRTSNGLGDMKNSSSQFAIAVVIAKFPERQLRPRMR